MRNRFLALAIVFFLSIALFSCESAKKPTSLEQNSLTQANLSGPKKRVGIFAFKNKSRYGQDKLTRAAVDILYTELEKSGIFDLYERADLAELEKEFDLIEAEKVNPLTAAEPGKLVGVQFVIIGSITQFGIKEEAIDYGLYKKKKEIAETTVDLRVVDITTGKVAYADSGSGTVERELKRFLGFGGRASFDETMADKALRSAMGQLISNLVKRVDELPWQGRVAEIDVSNGKQIAYLDAGRKSGMPLNAKLVVYRVMGKITHPETDAFLGYKTKRIGSALVFDWTGEDLSLAEFIPDSAKDKVQRGDIVVLEKDAGKAL